MLRNESEPFLPFIFSKNPLVTNNPTLNSHSPLQLSFLILNFGIFYPINLIQFQLIFSVKLI